MARKYKLGDKWSEDFDYDGMVEYGRTIDTKTSEKTIEKYADSLEDVNYHTLAKPLFDLEVAMSGDKEKIKRHFLVNFRRTLSKQLVEFGDKPLTTDEIYFFEKGGMTSKMYYIVFNEENGEKYYAEVPATSEKEAIEKLKKEGGVERIVSVRKMDNDEYAKGGKAEGYSKFKVLYIPYSGKTQEKMFDFYSEAYKYYDELVDDERGGGTTTIILQGYTDEYNEFEDIFYFDPMEMEEQDDDFAKGGEVDSQDIADKFMDVKYEGHDWWDGDNYKDENAEGRHKGAIQMVELIQGKGTDIELTDNLTGDDRDLISEILEYPNRFADGGKTQGNE